MDLYPWILLIELISEMAKSYDHLFKVVLVGDCDTGKAALIWTFCEQGMPAALFVPTIGVDFMIRVIEINSKKIKLQIWDTAGQERFRTITASYYRGASGILMVYDITRRETFESIRSWKSHIDEHKHKDVVVILVGNKCHLREPKAGFHRGGEKTCRRVWNSLLRDQLGAGHQR